MTRAETNTYLRIVQKAASNRMEERLRDDLARLTLYCQPPDPKARSATDLDEAMKEFTWWPNANLLERIEDGVLTIALTQRKFPERKIWKNFELVNKRKKKLHLLKQVNDLVERARERFIKANFSDLEALSWECREDKDAQNLLRDIGQIEKDDRAAKTIDWAQYKGILSRFSDDGSVAGASGSDTALACYARVLELIVDHRRWEKLRKESEALVYWLLKIGHLGATGKDDLEAFNRTAALRWVFEEVVRVGRERAAKLDKFQQSGAIIKKSKADIEDDQLMALVSRNNGDALAQLRKRHEGQVRATVRGILKSNSDEDDITQMVFTKVWKTAPEYVPTGKFTTFITTIAKRLAINEWERARKEKERIEFAHIGEEGYVVDQLLDEADDCDTDGGDSRKGDASQALSHLLATERHIIEGRFLCKRSERKDRHALAAELGITAQKVERLEKQALSKMRQVLDS
jgi:RNA polymerase sigma factor (sigma-70 family)